MLGPTVSSAATNAKRFELLDEPEKLLASLGYEEKFAALARVAHCRVTREKHVFVLQAGEERPALLVNLIGDFAEDAADPASRRQTEVFEHINNLVDPRREKLNPNSVPISDFV